MLSDRDIYDRPRGMRIRGADNEASEHEIIRLKRALRRVCESLETFIHESSDPGAEACAAVFEARRLLR